MKVLTLILSAVAIFATGTCVAATAPYTALTAPDKESARVLESPLKAIWGDTPASSDRLYAIHLNFPRVIEQNVARLDSVGARALIDNLSEKELSDLAQLYVTANADTGHNPQLLAILANRLDAPRLTRVSHHFGYEPVYEALLATSPTEAAAFAQTPGYGYLAPVPHANTVGSLRAQAAAGGGATAMVSGISQFIGYTPYETYLSLRTAPVGALGVQGALFETTVIYGAAAYGAW